MATTSFQVIYNSVVDSGVEGALKLTAEELGVELEYDTIKKGIHVTLLVTASGDEDKLDILKKRFDE